jgi:hypothetical protein
VKRARVGPSAVLRRAIPLSISAVVLAVTFAACGAATDTNPPIQPTPSDLPSTPSASPSPPATASTSPVESLATGSAEPSSAPSPTPSATTAHGPDQTAAACFGSSDTRDFFVAIAEAVTWPVYCAVLPAGWAVDAGVGKNTYALANGGRMVIGYHNDSGGHLELREGHWCTDSADACSPHDADIGPAQLGDQTGELMSLNSGYVLYLDPGRVASWTVTGTGLDQPTFTRLSAALALVGP